jgi:uroporphyrinogen III methyltransferase/synthase
VARYCREINWFEQRPLFGCRIVITRTRAQAGQLRQRLEQLGADVLEIPLIAVKPDHQPDRVKEVMGTLGSYAWLVFTSANGVRHFFDLFFQHYRDLRCLGGARIACIGPGTAEALAALHLEVDVVPEQSVAEALAEAIMAHETIENSTLLVVTGNRNRPVLVEKLEQEGRAIVDTLQVYATHAAVPDNSPDVQRFREEGADAVVFTSSSAVEAFATQAAALQLAPGARRPKVCSMGPITSETLRKKGLPVDREAADSSLDGLIATLRDGFST